MKQHITVEQLNELNQSEKHKLGLWCYEHKYFCVLRVTPPGEYGSISDLKTGKHWMIDKPLLSIGQMIEFLDEINYEGCSFHRLHKQFRNDFKFLPEEQQPKYWKMYSYVGKTEADELCDALWEVVKEVLK